MLVQGSSAKNVVVKITDFDELFRLKQTFTSSSTIFSQFRGMTVKLYFTKTLSVYCSKTT